MDTVLVEELTPRLREAAQGVGYNDDDTITPHGALRAWAQWKLGDPQWAEDFLRLYKNPLAMAR